MKYLSVLVLAVLLSGCYSVKITSDVSEEADFSKYKTYKFLGWAENSDKIMNQLDKERIQKAFREELSRRGLELVADNADMAVSLFVVVSKETSTTAYTNYYGGYGGRYRGYGYGWGGGMASTTYQENDYLAGTLVMDVFDEDSGDMVWQGVAKGTVTEDPERRKKTIPRTANLLMNKFPIEPIKEK